MGKESIKREGSASTPKGVKVKAELGSGRSGSSSKKASPGSSSKGGVAKKTGSSTAVKKEANVKDESDVYNPLLESRKPGQKNATPSPGASDRVFYESLLRQNPDSHMAQEWCLLYGVCLPAHAETLYKLVCKRKGIQPESAFPSQGTDTAARKPSGGKGRHRSSRPGEMEADTGFETSNVFEGVGTTGF